MRRVIYLLNNYLKHYITREILLFSKSHDLRGLWIIIKKRSDKVRRSLTLSLFFS